MPDPSTLGIGPPRRLRAYGLSLGFLALMAWPVVRHPPRDSFPLSDFPMFSHGRPNPFMRLTHALGVRADGGRVPLSPLVATGNREVLQAMVLLEMAAARDPARGCREIAGRVRDPALVAVELVTSEFDAVRYFLEAPRPLTRQVHARCPVPRS